MISMIKALKATFFIYSTFTILISETLESSSPSKKINSGNSFELISSRKKLTLPKDMILEIMRHCDIKALSQFGSTSHALEILSEEIFKAMAQASQNKNLINSQSKNSWRNSFISRHFIRQLGYLAYQDSYDSNCKARLQTMKVFFKSLNHPLYVIFKILNEESSPQNVLKYVFSRDNLYSKEDPITLEIQFVLTLFEPHLFDRKVYNLIGPKRSCNRPTLLRSFADKPLTLTERLWSEISLLVLSNVSWGIWDYYISALNKERALDVHYNLAYYFNFKRNWKELEKQSELILRKNPEAGIDVYYYYITALMRMSKLEEVVIQFEKALSKKLNFPKDVYLIYAVALMNLERFKEAAEQFKFITKEFDNLDYQIYASYGLCLASIRKFEEATIQFEKALRKSHEMVQKVHEHYALSLLWAKKLKKAEKEIQKIFNKFSNLSQELLFNYLYYLIECNKFQKAKEKVKMILESKPEQSWKIYSQYGLLLLMFDQFQQARGPLKKAIKAAPEFSSSLYENYMFCLIKLKEFQEIKKEYELILKKGTDILPIIHAYYVFCLQELGETEELNRKLGELSKEDYNIIKIRDTIKEISEY